jgi:catechol 2,3-dioxygenase-like lactoylglutathione lyase family enzyme
VIHYGPRNRGAANRERKEALLGNTYHSSRDVICRTPRWIQAREFYERILGFKVAAETDTILRVETGAFRLFVEKGDPHGPVFDFLVPDVQAAKNHLLAAGCVLVEEDPSVPRCYLQDPFGLVFNLGRTATPE